MKVLSVVGDTPGWTYISEIFHEMLPASTRETIRHPELAAEKTKAALEPILLELGPGGETDEDDPHEGEEFGYVLSGSVRLVIGDRVERVRKDESFYFKPTAPHKLVNAGKSACRVLWVSTPPSF